MALIVHYPLTQDTNDVVNGNHLTPSRTIPTGAGRTGNAYVLNGSSDYLTSDRVLPINKDNPFTISFWFKCEYDFATSRKSIYSFGDASFNEYNSVDILIDDNDTVRISHYFYSNDGADLYTGIHWNNWIHCTVTYDGNTRNIYLNGELALTDVIISTNTTSSVLTLGRDYLRNTAYFPGRINDFRVYNHVCSEKEIKELARGKIVHWSFNNISDTIYDLSGNGHHGTKGNNVNVNTDSALGSSSARFDPVSSGVVSAPGFYYICDQISVNSWVYLESHATQQSPLQEGDVYQVIRSGKLSGYWHGASNPGYHFTNASIPLYTWTMLTSVWDGNNLHLYINGVLDKTITGVVASGATRTLTPRCGYVSSSRNLDGSISDVKMYATSLSADDVKSIYSSKANIDPLGNMRVNELVEYSPNSYVSDDLTFSGVTRGSIYRYGVYKNLPVWRFTSTGNDAYTHYSTQNLTGVIPQNSNIKVTLYARTVKNVSGSPNASIFLFHEGGSVEASRSFNCAFYDEWIKYEFTQPLTGAINRFRLDNNNSGDIIDYTLPVIEVNAPDQHEPGVNANGIAHFSDVSEVGNTDGLEGFWKYRTAEDLSGNGNNISTTGYAYVTGSMLIMNTNAGYVTYDGTRNIDCMRGDSSKTFTLLCHFKPYTTTQDSEAVVFGKWGQHGGLLIHSNKIVSRNRTASGTVHVLYDTDVISLQEYVGVITYDGTTTELYVNGVRKATNTIKWDYPYSTDFMSGHSSNQYNFNGEIYETKVFTRALTPTEVAIESKRLLSKVNTSIISDGALHINEIQEGH